MNQKIDIRILTVVIIAMLSMAVSVHSEDSKRIEIRTIDIRPYGIKTEPESKPSGIYYDFANLLASEAGYQINNYIAPYARIILELQSGQTDLSILFKYKKLEDHVIYVAPLPSLETVVIGLKDTHFKSMEDLKGRSLAYLRGAKFSDAIDNDPAITSIETVDFNQGIKLLAVGRVDAIIGPIEPILNAAVKLGKDRNFFGKPFVVSERTPWVQISKKSAERINVEELRTHFQTIKMRGDLNKIRQKYTKNQ